MNILFFNNAEISPIANGIQRTTGLLSDSLTKTGKYNCFSAFYEYNSLPVKTEFTQKFKITRGNEYEEFKQVIIEYNIDFIICQQVIASEKTFENISLAAKEQNCKFIYCLHASPDYNFTRPNIKSEIYAIIHKSQGAKGIRKLAVGLLPKFIYNHLVNKQIKKQFTTYNNSFDKIVLLSERFIHDYIRLSNMPVSKHQNVVAIPNILTFTNEVSANNIENKENIILIVSRLSERQKRISDSLKIWKEIECKTDIEDWKLIILGTGNDEAYYKYLAKKLNIKNVCFEGRQDPLEYYKRASIYMMTSAYEGFPMVLTEAEQMGVVPIAFDSFNAVHDVIENEFNGIIIENKNVEIFANRLLYLMKNKKIRESMAKNAFSSCQKFLPDEVSKLWDNLFTSLI